MQAFVLICTVVATMWAQTQQTENTLRLGAGASSPKATITDVAWLAGQWQGSGLDASAEEIWTPPAAGSMMGSFRIFRDGVVWFYELCSIAEHQGTLMLRLKHFHGDLKGWEDKNEVREFPLVKQDAATVWFDGITFRKDGPDAMSVFVAIKRGGTLSEGRFSYKRAAELKSIRP
jgi:hypothetical protein